jgi:hypothetical protein
MKMQFLHSTSLTLHVSNSVAEHDFLWKITGDVLTECLWTLECTIRVVGDCIWNDGETWPQAKTQPAGAGLTLFFLT